MIVMHALVPSAVAESAGEEFGLSALTEGPLAALYRESASAPPGDVETITAYGQVLLELTGRTDLLPVRFGTVLKDVSALRELLRSRQGEWLERLGKVAGHVELIVHVTWRVAEEPPPVSASGRDYLMNRASLQRRRMSVQDELLMVVGRYATSTRRLPATIDDPRLACLVPIDRADTLCRAVEEWAADVPGVKVAVTGPFPVLSFTEEYT